MPLFKLRGSKTSVVFADEGAETGSTAHFSGSVGTSDTNVPAVDAGSISQVLVECPISNTGTLSVSFDDGVGFKVLEAGSNIVWSPRGAIKHLVLKGSEAGVTFDLVINRNDP